MNIMSFSFSASAAFSASAEQVAICDAIKDSPAGTILRISAVAGSGKTSTNLYVASQFRDRKILLLTYNKFLAEETRTKIDKMKLTNIEVRTFHGFAGRLFGKAIYNDDILIELLRESSEEKYETGDEDDYEADNETGYKDYSNLVEEDPASPDYDIIVFDEVQDLTLPLYKLCEVIFLRYIKPFNESGAANNVRLMLFGDPRQCIYGYNGADSRYMKLADSLFGAPVIDLELSVSYRVTNQIATFINEICYGGQHIISGAREGPLPKMIVRTRPGAYKYVAQRIVKLVNAGVNPEEIFILSASAKIKSSSTCGLLSVTNVLASHGIMSFIDTDGHTADHKCLSKKVVVSSIHKSKGRERKYVFFVGFDHTYFKYFSRDYKTKLKNYVDGNLIMPNELYVALTRSSHKLWLVAQSESQGKFIEPIEFIDRDLIRSYANCRDDDTKVYFKSSDSWTPNEDVTPESKITVTDLVGSMEAMNKNRLKSCLKITVIRQPKKVIELVSMIKEKDPKYGVYYEDVSDINGIASVLSALKDDLTNQELYDYCTAEYGRRLDLFSSSSVLMEAKNIQCKYKKHKARARQVVNNSWIPEKTLSKLSARIRNTMPIGTCEKCVAHNFGTVTVVGKIDNLYGNNLYEIKTKTGVSLDDFIQLSIYRVLLGHVKYDPMQSIEAVKKRRAEHLNGPIGIGSIITVGDHYGTIISIDSKKTKIKAKMVSFIDGSTISVKDPKLYEPYYLNVPDDLGPVNILYNCRDDSMYSVEIVDYELFEQLMFAGIDDITDHEFLYRARQDI